MRRYTHIEQPDNHGGEIQTPISSEYVVGMFHDLMLNQENLNLLYNVSEIHYSHLTKIDHPIAAMIMETQQFPSKAEVTIYDDFGTVLLHYCMRQKVIHFIQQKDNFHQILLLMINQQIRKTTMINPPYIDTLTSEHFIEVNRTVIQYMNQLRYGEKKHV